jgi:hypothetical protein
LTIDDCELTIADFRLPTADGQWSAVNGQSSMVNLPYFPSFIQFASAFFFSSGSSLFSF